MHFRALAFLAFLASGCTINVVEQPATPLTLAGAPRPTRPGSAGPRPIVYVPAVAAADRKPDARPPAVATPAPSAMPMPVAMPAPIAARPNRERPHVIKPARRASRIPFKTLPPETRSPRLVSATPASKRDRAQTGRRGEAIQLVSSTDVTKAQ